MAELKKCEHCGGEFDSGDRMMWMQHEAATCVVTKPRRSQRNRRSSLKADFQWRRELCDD